MKRSNKVFIWILLIIVVPRIVVSCTFWGNRTYSGRVIDADTLEPIEGTVVVAVWNKSWPGIGAGRETKFKMAKEVLTDANGEWSIKGPRGRQLSRENEWMEIFYLITYIHYTKKPSFIFYKPGYCRPPQKPGGFTAHVYRDEKRGMEGIVLWRPGNTREEVKKFLKDYEYEMPFVPVEDPTALLKSSEFSFQYSEDFIRIPRHDLDRPFWVLGLKKAETWEERRRATSYDTYTPRTPPLLKKMIQGEDEYLKGVKEK